MAKSKKKDFFSGSGKLKLQREIEAGRDTKSGNKGFLNELKRRDQRRGEYHEAKKEGQTDSLFKGQDVAPQKKPEKMDSDWMGKEPEEARVTKEEGRFPAEANWIASRKGIK